MANTKQRALILNIVKNSGKRHLNAEQIYHLAKLELPTIVLATVYNNLNVLYKNGQIGKVTLDGADVFDKSPIKHGHMLCKSCGKISDVMLPSLKEEIEDNLGFGIDYYELTVTSTCEDCRK